MYLFLSLVCISISFNSEKWNVGPGKDKTRRWDKLSVWHSIQFQFRGNLPESWRDLDQAMYWLKGQRNKQPCFIFHTYLLCFFPQLIWLPIHDIFNDLYFYFLIWKYLTTNYEYNKHHFNSVLWERTLTLFLQKWLWNRKVM